MIPYILSAIPKRSQFANTMVNEVDIGFTRNINGRDPLLGILQKMIRGFHPAADHVQQGASNDAPKIFGGFVIPFALSFDPNLFKRTPLLKLPDGHAARSPANLQSARQIIEGLRFAAKINVRKDLPNDPADTDGLRDLSAGFDKPLAEIMEIR